MSPAIQIENLSKQYRVGEIGLGSIAHDFNRWWYRMRGKPDPYLSVTEANDRAHAGKSDYVWALKDINLEVREGEVLGIIGRNGAGKSTLLKILSRVTAPTSGTVRVRGRMASLLEVGTGFHPDLTGRENIYLNGAILGMSRKEISAKLDEIVDFSGCERYLDTPVKRYSSGMMVRLGFAVAAHLDPEILVVDEVLAVGDAEFQQKCLGRMKESSQSGRTILFVSHQLNAVSQLCNRSLCIHEGRILADGPTGETIRCYLDLNTTAGKVGSDEEYFVVPCPVRSICASIHDISGKETSHIPFGNPWSIRAQVDVVEPLENMVVAVGLCNTRDIPVQTTWSDPHHVTPGTYTIEFRQDRLFLECDSYRFRIGVSQGSRPLAQSAPFALELTDSGDSHPAGYVPIKSGVGHVLNSMTIRPLERL